MKNYQTSDFYIASFLYAKGIPFVGLNKANKSYLFIFKNAEDCNKLALQQYQGKADVNARSFIEAIKTLKSLIFS